ncbi:MAG: hypothetical protein WCG47_16600 [Dermatophilaceae bacterium]
MATARPPPHDRVLAITGISDMRLSYYVDGGDRIGEAEDTAETTRV